MTIHTDRITLVFPIAAKNRQAAASLQTLEITESGQEFEKLVPLDPALVANYASAFNLPLIAELSTAQAELAANTTELATATQAKTTLEAEKAELRELYDDLRQTLTEEEQLTATLQAKIATANATVATRNTTITANNSEIAAKTAIIESLTDEKQELSEQLATANATITTLQAEVVKLTAIRQYNPRWTTPDYFINRFTAHEAKAFYSSNDPIIIGGRELLEEYETADPPYYVDLDDAQVQGLTGYMVQLGMMSMERRDQVLSDVTAQEAFYPA
jgi:DNA gyrase/topoisomerase IV subunit A